MGPWTVIAQRRWSSSSPSWWGGDISDKYRLYHLESLLHGLCVDCSCWSMNDDEQSFFSLPPVEGRYFSLVGETEHVQCNVYDAYLGQGWEDEVEVVFDVLHYDSSNKNSLLFKAALPYKLITVDRHSGILVLLAKRQCKSQMPMPLNLTLFFWIIYPVRNLHQWIIVF